MGTHCTLNSAFTDCHTGCNSPRARQCSGTRLVLKSSICFLAGTRFQKCTSCSFYQTSSQPHLGLQTSFSLPWQYPGMIWLSRRQAQQPSATPAHPITSSREGRAPGTCSSSALGCVPETWAFPGTWQELQNQL